MTLLACPKCDDLCSPGATHCVCGAALILGFGDHGYWHLRVHGHPLAQRSGKVRLHRLIAQRELGQDLLPSEVVHHINGDKLDNRPENLQVIASSGEHVALHHRLRREAA